MSFRARVVAFKMEFTCLPSSRPSSDAASKEIFSTPPPADPQGDPAANAQAPGDNGKAGENAALGAPTTESRTIPTSTRNVIIWVPKVKVMCTIV